MGNMPLIDSLVGRILAGPSRAVLLSGPARCGKTSAALALYRRLAEGTDHPGCLLLVPDAPAARELRDRLLAQCPGQACAARRIMTFGDFVGRILLVASVPHRWLSPTGRRAVLANILGELSARGGLVRLARLIDAPGLVQSAERALAELKRAGAAPDALLAAPDDEGRHRELIAVYRRYQAYLADHQLYDDEDRYVLARDRLARLDGPVLEGLRAVVADGFTNLLPGQIEILQLLARRLERVVVTLTLDEEPRQDLWRWSVRQRDRLRRAFGESLTELASQPEVAAERPWPARLADRLFATDDEPMSWPTGLSFLAAPGLEAECRAIARWAKAHLADGRRAEDLAIVARDIAPYRPVLARVFTEAGLAPPAGAEPLGRTPVGRLLGALVRAADRFGYAEVLAVLTSSYVRPEVLGDFDVQTAQAAQLLIRHGNVLEGREQYARAAAWLTERVARLAEELPEEDELASPLDHQLRRLGTEGMDRAARLLEALFDRLAPIHAGGTLKALARATRDLLTGLDLPGGVRNRPCPVECGADDEQTVADDLRALGAIDAVLAELEALPATDQPLTAQRFANVLDAILAQAVCPSALPAGAVMAASAPDICTVPVKHLWLAGLNEGVFPAATAPQHLFNEADRLTWSRQGLDLEFHHDLAAREGLLFYLTVTRAQGSLSISWLHDDGNGEAMSPSMLAEELARPLGGLASRQDRVRNLPLAQFTPPSAEMLSPRERLNAALGAAGRRDGSTEPSALAGLRAVAERDPSALERLAWPIWAAHRRWRRGHADAYDGVIDEPDLLAELAKRVSFQSVFSVSQINTYLTCPWRYFAQRWLKLVELPEPAEALVPRQRGLLVHAVLRRVMRRLSGTPLADRRTWGGPELAEVVDQALAEEAAHAGGVGPAGRVLWQIELDQTRAIVLAYLRRQAGLDVPNGQVRHAELAFGMSASPDTDPASSDEPLTLQGPAGAVRLCGKIDRVDVLTGHDGKDQVFVVDYKTGHLPDPARDSQLPVYIATAARLTGLDPAGGAYHAVRAGHLREQYLAEFDVVRGKCQANDRFDNRLAAGLDLVHQAVAGIAAGNFNVFASQRCPLGSCPLRRICGHGESRGLYKIDPDQASSAPAGREAADG